MASQIVGLH